jgi:uncharacterized peroxidase-related enzyme
MAIDDGPRIAMLEDRDVDERARTVFGAARERYGWLPNTVRVMVRSGSAAEIYLSAGELNGRTGLSAPEREAIAVAVAARNRCEYCLAAHSASLEAFGTPFEEVRRAREGTSINPRTGAVLAFTVAVLDLCGAVEDDDFAAALAAGLDHETLLDIAAVIAENTLGNYVNNIARTPLDQVLKRAADKHLGSAATGVSR